MCDEKRERRLPRSVKSESEREKGRHKLCEKKTRMSVIIADTKLILLTKFCRTNIYYLFVKVWILGKLSTF